MNVIPFRQSQQVKTDAMSETEASSSIPPWPVDFGPRRVEVEPEPLDGAGAVVVPVLVLAAVACAAVVAVLL